MPSKPVGVIEVSVNYFIGDTNNSKLTHLIHLSRCMLHGILGIFLTSEITQHGGGDSVLEKKLDKGKKTWAYKKEILNF